MAAEKQASGCMGKKKKNQQRKRIKFKAWVYGNLIYNKDSITKQVGIKLFRV